MKRLLASLMLLAACTVAGFAQAQEDAGAPAALADPELAEIRAGFVTAEGVSFSFAAQARSYVDGALVLESRLMIDGGGRQEIAPPPVTLSGRGGVTRVEHGFGANDFRNVIVNTANDRIVRQELNIVIAIPDLAAFQRQAADQQRALRLVDSLTVNLRDAAVR